MASPKYLYKVLDAAPPHPLPATLPTTPLDAGDGFIHLSTAEQTSRMVGLFFGNANKLWVLRLKLDALDGRIEYSTDPDVGVVDGCAHLHDSKNGLGSGNVEEVIEVTREEGQEWREAGDWKKL